MDNHRHSIPVRAVIRTVASPDEDRWLWVELEGHFQPIQAQEDGHERLAVGLRRTIGLFSHFWDHPDDWKLSPVPLNLNELRHISPIAMKRLEDSLVSDPSIRFWGKIKEAY